MQKKPTQQPQAQQHSQSNWENNLKKQERRGLFKKIAIWAGIVFACFAGLLILVKLAANSGPSATLVTNEKLKPVLKNDMVEGNPQAKVVIYEYADFQCPACSNYNTILNQVLSEYDGKVKVVFRTFPLKGIHSNAALSGQAAFAAWKLGNFKDMKDMLFDKQGDWENLDNPTEVFGNYAVLIGLNEAKFLEIMNSDEAKQAIAESERDSINLGINATPTFFIGNRQFSPNGFDGFKKVIDEELAGSASQTPLK